MTFSVKTKNLAGNFRAKKKSWFFLAEKFGQNLAKKFHKNFWPKIAQKFSAKIWKILVYG